MNSCSNDCGSMPFVTDIRKAALENDTFRTALWTGDNLQCTLMCIPECGDIGAEVHKGTDQLICIVSGCCKFVYANPRTGCKTEKNGESGCTFFVPEGTKHNVINTGSSALKLFSVYAPPHHPKGTIQCDEY